MNLPTIEMEKGKAQEAFDQYRAAVKERHDAEDEQIMRAYRELAKGTALLRLTEALVAGGTTIRHINRWREGRRQRSPITLPRLAICRAHQDYAWTQGIGSDGSLTIIGKREVSPGNRRDRIVLPKDSFPGIETDKAGWDSDVGRFNAMVPKVPPALRPPHSLANYHVLWEADWRVAPGPPPGDPALLKHIGGDLYAVLATWDLTEVERAVLAGRELA